MSLVDFSVETIREALDKLMAQSAQMFSFQPVETFMEESRTSEVCFMLGVSADLVKRWKEDGLTVDEADKVACRLGEHPSMIWAEWGNVDPIADPLFDAVEDYMRSHKLCSRCNDWVPRENFHRRTASKDGIARYCTPCMKIYEKERRK